MIHLEIITNQNIKEVILLSKTLDDVDQKKVASNAISLAQAYVNPTAWPRAIYEDNTLVGFIMLNLKDVQIPDSDQPAYYLWRLMISKPYQHKGYGKAVLNLIKEKCKTDHQKTLYVTCTMIEEMPYQFYIQNGFIDTKEMDEDEQILKMEFKYD